MVATTAPLPGLDEPRIVFEGTGDVEVVGTDSPATPDSPLPSTVTATVEVAEVPRPDDPAEAVLADASRSTVVATLRATSPEGVVLEASDTVWVDEFRGELLASEEGELDLRLQRVDVLEADGIVTSQEADGLRELAQGAGAETVQSVVAGACVGVCVSGTVRWTDSAGATHPVDRAAVQIRDDDGALDETVTTVTTDADGDYSATIDNADGDATGRDVYVRVLADGPGFTLDHHVDGAVAVDVADGSQLTQDVTADNVEDNNTAFSVRAGLVIARDAVAELRGGALPAIAVVFPDDLGSFYDGDALHLVQPDRFDWDVALHEYGHYVADELNIENNPGGRHSFSENLSDARGSKVVGTRLAWGEGWPTYFGVSTLVDHAALGVPTVGDARYQDTEDSNLDVSLEGRPTLGEDNERTVMNILWDLFDAHDDGRDHVALGAQSVWDTLDAGDPETLSDAYALLSPNKRRGAGQLRVHRHERGASDRRRRPVVRRRDRRTRPRSAGGGATAARTATTASRSTFRGANGVRLFTSPVPPRPELPTARRTPGGRSGALSEGAVRVSVVGRQTDAPAHRALPELHQGLHPDLNPYRAGRDRPGTLGLHDRRARVRHHGAARPAGQGLRRDRRPGRSHPPRRRDRRAGPRGLRRRGAGQPQTGARRVRLGADPAGSGRAREAPRRGAGRGRRPGRGRAALRRVHRPQPRRAPGVHRLAAAGRCPERPRRRRLRHPGRRAPRRRCTSEAQPVLAGLAAALSRFGGYASRLQRAVDEVRAGHGEWFDKPLIDSFHSVWFELHEDLLATLGLERSTETGSEG